ncbi:MAG TPA: hypothetical protein VJO35_16375 [Terriglobales bacterium]|nr:hypothetical protein [Terriglobales bacterium]
MGRIFGFLGLLIVAAIIFYLTTKQAQTVSGVGGGGTVQSAEVMTGVRGDLIGIANAERQYNVSEGKYGSIDDLVSAHYISVSSRPPYSYNVQTTSSGFRVMATRSGTVGGPSQIWVDENMEIQTSN